MKKQTIRRIFAISVVILGASSILSVPLTKISAEEPHYTVIIDPGHGGEDGGAVADDGTLEKDLNLTIALLLKERLEKQNVTVIMTRDTDDDTDGLLGFHKREDLEARAKLGNESGADIFVSIHINASTARRDQGFQVWYGSGNDDGKHLATAMTQQVQQSGICNRIRVVKQVPETLYIFRTVKIPSILVECGFITNAADLRLLKEEPFREQLATALCEGILIYLSGSNTEMR